MEYCSRFHIKKVFLKMDNAPGALPRRYVAPIAMTLYYQDKGSLYYRRITGAPAPNRGRDGKKGASTRERT